MNSDLKWNIPHNRAVFLITLSTLSGRVLFKCVHRGELQPGTLYSFRAPKLSEMLFMFKVTSTAAPTHHSWLCNLMRALNLTNVEADTHRFASYCRVAAGDMEPRYSVQVSTWHQRHSCVFGSFSFLRIVCVRIISYRPSKFWPLKAWKYNQSTSCIADSVLSTKSWWHGWNSGQLRVSWDWTPANRNRRIRILTTRSVARSFFHCAEWSHLQERKGGVVSVTVGLFVLKTGSVHWRLTKVTKFLPVISASLSVT